MRHNLLKYSDKGWWISDDRVNAFLSVMAGGIGEIGFHGSQPVSRNSRLLVCSEGVLTFALALDGREFPLAPRGDVEISPATISWSNTVGAKELTTSVAVSHTMVVIEFPVLLCQDATVRVRFDRRALFTQVQGTREWADPVLDDHELLLRCRDSILLNEWMKRKGPYAGDFLIPEPIRRMVFQSRCRSGLATEDDLRPEFRDMPLPIYDAWTCIRLGGKGWTVELSDTHIQWRAPAEKPTSFVVGFATGTWTARLRETPTSIHNTQQSRYEDILARSPSLAISGDDVISGFFRSVPGIVESCKVRDFGMTRATPGAYYWIWAWDNIVTGMEMLRWGDTAGVRQMLTFINAHRDEGGAIPARWTRSLQPLDTPEPGALEALSAVLLLQYVFETGDRQPLLDAYPFMVAHLRRMTPLVNGRGLFPNIGFYPDLPLKYGRTVHSAVALEVGALYVFCRCLEDAARDVADPATAGEAARLASLVGDSFLENFWDDQRGVLFDSIDLNTGEQNRSFPLFTLLFLQCTSGLSLLRDRIPAIAEFMYAHHLGDVGTGLVPGWDLRRGTEPALASWYPHWDLYMLKILRRAGHADGILKWLANVRALLTHLGYVPEFLDLADASTGEKNRWSRHGAYANLNCVTGCYHGLIEGVVGLECSREGMALLPLPLPLGKIVLDGLVYKNTRWTVEVKNDGPRLEQVVLDDERLVGTLKVPPRYHDGGHHRMQIRYA
jgi:hypothetical protein